MMTAHPTIDPGPGAASQFARDGVLVVRDVFADWTTSLAAGIARNMRDPGPDAKYHLEQAANGRFFEDYCNWKRIPEFLDFIENSGISGLAGQVMGAARAQFYHEHVLVKGPATPTPTPWHQDMPYYGLAGQQTVSIWIPLDPIRPEIAFSLLRGSHRQTRLFRPTEWTGGTSFYGETGDFEDLPVISDDNPDIVSPDLEPGDAVLFDFRTLHAAAGNPGNQYRRAFSARFVGEDVVCAGRPGPTSPPFPGIDFVEGRTLPQEDFPILWRRPVAS